LHKFYSSISNLDEVRACLIDTLYNNKKNANPPANIKPDNWCDQRILPNVRKDPSIIITKADKSNSLVVMDAEDYNTKIYTNLNDKTTYKTITHDHTDQF